MPNLAEYLADPCGTLSLPYWKAGIFTPPPGLRVLHDRDFDPALLAEWEDCRYFRLLHDLKEVGREAPAGILLQTAGPEQTGEIVRIINASYADIRVDAAQIEGYRRTAVYDPALWVMAADADTGRLMGCGIADYDPEAGELILEWIQVLPEYRRRGVGRAIVDHLLGQKQGIARFATVSGRADDPCRPERLYRSCGFAGNDLWHVLRPRKIAPTPSHSG